jgi:hypothetical protein
MSVANFLIPLDNFPEQFDISLAGVQYIMISKWNDAPDAGWVLDIQDSTGTPIACNVPLITGDDCLDGLGYLGINGSLFVQTTGASPLDVPTYANLGVDCNLYFQTTDLNND